MATTVNPATYSINFVPPSMTTMYALHGVALLAIGASIVGSFLVVYISVRKNQMGTIGERFPVYVAFLDFLWSVSHSIDHIMMIVNKGDNPPQNICVGLGAILALFLMAQVMLLNLIAVSMFLSVYKGWSLNYFGPYDIYLWVLSFGVPIVYTIIGRALVSFRHVLTVFVVSVGAFGPDLYWCYLNPDTSAGWIMWSITFIAAVCCIALPAFCYYMIYNKLKEVEKKFKDLHSSDKGTSSSINGGATTAGALESGTTSSNAVAPAGKGGAKVEDPVAKKNRKIVEKLLSFEMVLIITFSSLIIYGACIVARQEPVWIVYVVVICFNSAGWLNALVWWAHERKKGKGSDGK
ncbi:hypothetical protein HDU96_009034 [Phlyctochytrium bullatum]|nr:hypothetical protein HDU96_009034 [Phlyctochytrium bullatum]